MEKISCILITFLVISLTASAQPTDNLNIEESNLQDTSERKKAKIILYQEINIEGGVSIARLPNDTVNMKFAGMPFLTASLDNYLSERFLFSFFLSPISIYYSRDEYQSFQQRSFQVEAGITAGFYPIRDLRFSLGAGYAFRFFRQYKTGAESSWHKTEKKGTPGIIGYASISYWFHTNIALQCSGILTMDGYAIRAGIVINPRLISSAFKSMR